MICLLFLEEHRFGLVYVSEEGVAKGGSHAARCVWITHEALPLRGELILKLKGDFVVCEKADHTPLCSCGYPGNLERAPARQGLAGGWKKTSTLVRLCSRFESLSLSGVLARAR